MGALWFASFANTPVTRFLQTPEQASYHALEVASAEPAVSVGVEFLEKLTELL